MLVVLVYDDSELPINSPNGKANKKALGLGLQVYLKNHTAIVAKYVINEIDDDTLMDGIMVQVLIAMPK